VDAEGIVINPENVRMFDAVFLLAVIASFAALAALVHGCERL